MDREGDRGQREDHAIRTQSTRLIQSSGAGPRSVQVTGISLGYFLA